MSGKSAQNAGQVPGREAMEKVALRLNEVLARYSDKDWAYSRIALSVAPLDEIEAPYLLWLEWIGTMTREGEKAFKDAQDEMTWGERHSSELGILEIISLRLNRALSSVSTAADFDGSRPVVRMMRKSDLLASDIRHAFWYRVTEVQGEEFDNR